MPNICPLCHEIPQCPVTLNGFPNNGNGCEGKMRKCTFSQSNPACLLCVRDYMYHHTEKKELWFACFSKCCYIHINGYQTYGDIGRSPEDVAEPTLWRWMDTEGVVECRRCEKNCNTVYELGIHIKNSCPCRKVMCEICNTLVDFKDFEEHKKQCSIFCVDCDQELIAKTCTILPLNDTRFNWIKIHDHKVLKDGKYVVLTQKNPLIVLEHLCINKPISMCTICSKEITMSNISLHEYCTKSVSDHKKKESRWSLGTHLSAS